MCFSNTIILDEVRTLLMDHKYVWEIQFYFKSINEKWIIWRVFKLKEWLTITKSANYNYIISNVQVGWGQMAVFLSRQTVAERAWLRVRSRSNFLLFRHYLLSSKYGYLPLSCPNDPWLIFNYVEILNLFLHQTSITTIHFFVISSK